VSDVELVLPAKSDALVALLALATERRILVNRR
jgi:hypothetical protein